MGRGGRRRKTRVQWAVLAVLFAAAVFQALRPDGFRPGEATAAGVAFAEGRSDVQVTVNGRVTRTLSDDTEGSRHQRFILQTASGQTVLIVHNIDLAPRVPLTTGDSVEVFGEYVWNEQGGLVHWTHHDPDGSHPGGWIRHEGRVYQ